ncbi:MAG: hypothetical protein R2688_09625 [Fimbriimonadaceae bacterium]|nr:hypothetical protein [Armatimonadota bacterium]
MKTLGKAALVTTLGVALVAPAMADYDKPMGMSLRAGLYLAQGSLKNAEGQNWFVGGLEYRFRDGVTFAGAMGDYSMSLDYYGKGSFHSAPLLMNFTTRNSDNLYYSVGAGVAFIHSNFGGNSDSKMDFGYQFSLGKDLVKAGNPVFIELKYFGASDTRYNGFAIMGGIRF